MIENLIAAVNAIAEHIIENGRTVVHKPWTGATGALHHVNVVHGVRARTYQSKFSVEPVQFHSIESGLMSCYVTTPRGD